jgi:hypothetical protein
MKIKYVVFISCLFCVTNLFANSARPICSMQLLCNQLTPEDNLPGDSVHENAPADMRKLQLLFSENKIAILKLLAQKKNSIPVTEFAKMETAITTVGLGRFDEPAFKKVFPGACDRPNAIYIPGMHRVFVCPSLLRYPTLTLQQILAHELGHAIQRMQDYVPCFSAFPKAQLDEVFADWVASKVLAGKLASERNPTIAGKQALQSQLLFLSLGCDDTQKTKPDWAHTHPNLQNRVEQIFLSQPAFQEALRCQAKNTTSCG